MNVLRYRCKFREYGGGCRESFDDANTKGQKIIYAWKDKNTQKRRIDTQLECKNVQNSTTCKKQPNRILTFAKKR